MAEQGGVGRAALQREIESVDVVNALAGIGAFAEHVLIDVGNRGSVRIDAAQAGENALEQRAFESHRKRRGHARLHHAIALDDAPRLRIETRPVERMRHLADQAADSVARQARIGVERDDIARVGRRERRGAIDVDETRIVAAA